MKPVSLSVTSVLLARQTQIKMQPTVKYVLLDNIRIRWEMLSAQCAMQDSSVILQVKCVEAVREVDLERMRDLTLESAMIALKDIFKTQLARRRVCHVCQASLAMNPVSSLVTNALSACSEHPVK